MADYMSVRNARSNKSNYFVPTAKQIEKWLSLNDVKYKSGSKDQIRVCNPDGDTKFNMAISKSKAVVHDFRVSHRQYDGSFVRFVSKYKGISIHEAISEIKSCHKSNNSLLLSNKNNEIEEDNNDDEEIEDEILLPNGSESIRNIKSDSMMYRIVYNYLTKDRGLDRETIFGANVHYLGTSIVVPYYEYGMIVFWQIRHQLSKRFIFPDSSLKSAGDFLYGFDNVEPKSFVIIAESIFNSLSIGADCVATGGAALKKGQIDLLSILSPEEIILAPDNDGAGRKSLEKDYLSLYKRDWEINYCLPPYCSDEDIDWNDMKRLGIDPRTYVLNNKRKLTMKEIFNGVDYKSFQMPS